MPIPFWDSQPALVSAPFMKVANAVYGKSPMTENTDAFTSRHDLLNLIMDFFEKSLRPPYELETDKLHPDDRHIDSIYPGQVLRIQRNSASQDPVIRPVSTGDLPTGFWQFLQFFQNTFSEFTGMTPELMGQVRSRGRTTANEFNARMAESGQLMAEIYKGIEEDFLSPTLNLIFMRTLQFMPQEMWAALLMTRKSEIIDSKTPPEVAAKWETELRKAALWTPVERYTRLAGFFRFTPKVYSNLMERQAMIEQITYTLQTAGRIPQALGAIRIPKLFVS